MNTQLQRIEIERAILRNHNLPIEHTSCRQLLQQRLDQLREVTIERLFIATLNHHFHTVAKYQRSKSIPLGLKNPLARTRQFTNALREHRQNRRVHRKLHSADYNLAPPQITRFPAR